MPTLPGIVGRPNDMNSSNLNMEYNPEDMSSMFPGSYAYNPYVPLQGSYPFDANKSSTTDTRFGLGLSSAANSTNAQELGAAAVITVGGNSSSSSSGPSASSASSASSTSDIPSLSTGQTQREQSHFVVGDEVIYGKELGKIVSLDWNRTPPQAEVCMDASNFNMNIPISHLTLSQRKGKPVPSSSQQQHLMDKSISKDRTFYSQKFTLTKKKKKERMLKLMLVSLYSLFFLLLLFTKGFSACVYVYTYTYTSRLVYVENSEGKDVPKSRKNHFQRLSEETLMKLPHLRKVKQYIKAISIDDGPRAYSTFRETLNGNTNANEGTNRPATDDNNTSNVINKMPSSNDHESTNTNTAGNSNKHSRRRNRRKGYPQEKSDLYKTELCENWVMKGNCTYGRKCHFAHGHDEIQYRARVANYKTQPCCDPARSDSRLCLFGKRCNYAHPGEPLRCGMPDEYVDEEYFDKICREYVEEFPFGIYL
ncbi:hypothetical protein RFI_15366 [Reticulomyxa filosa]|uniref:C3H1-type domain-containing protein n=1 Tax=Reticulomyxa filosa TaxID=46433 RepID=X6N968_RETFI|nr:hypothetical protein RFI_15366 [Reticulomyxa filosa]|eukprot:ETO21837.1 hypothetical protein RFI_15366 [Reticulomyxa filosa]